MANDNQDALTTSTLLLGGGAAGYAAGRWIVARWLDSKGAHQNATTAPAVSPPAAPSPATGSTSPAPRVLALPPGPSSAQVDGSRPATSGRDNSSSGLPGRYPPAVERWRALVTELANGIDVDFLLTWIRYESGGNPCATGIPNTETGLFQSYHPDDDRHGATFAELRTACDAGAQTAHRPLTAAEQRLHISAGIALVRACLNMATSTLQSIGAQWSTRDRYRLTKLVHALPSYAYRFPRAYVARYGRPPASWMEFRAWVRSLSENEAIAIDRAVRPWASGEQRDHLFDNAERTGNAVPPVSPRHTVAEVIRDPRASNALAWSASRLSGDPVPRGASWWSIKTPAVILDEMNAAKNEVESLGRDIYATFRHTFDAQLAAAEARFLKTYGRKPGVGKQAQDTDYQTVYSWMQPVPSADDIRHVSYQGQFVYQWGEFEREFGTFWAEHSDSWTDRMWRGTYDKAVEYRQRVGDWRKRFEEIGGKPTTPPPKPPTEQFLPPGFSIPWKPIAVIGGIAAGALIIPAAIRASRRD
jgi:hypothetical protein